MSVNIEELKQGVNSFGKVIDDVEPESEFAYRNYCGRSYYTVFHQTKKFLNEKHNFDEVIANGAYHNMGTHQIIMNFLDEHIHIPSRYSNRDYKKLVYRLKAMRQNRVDSDYDLDINVNYVTYEQSKKQYECVLDLIENLSAA